MMLKYTHAGIVVYGNESQLLCRGDPTDLSRNDCNCRSHRPQRAEPSVKYGSSAGSGSVQKNTGPHFRNYLGSIFHVKSDRK